ncbi:hypothetical protein CWI38_2499p0010, partial [Hamiltosporidium tvaerminnensis]
LPVINPDSFSKSYLKIITLILIQKPDSKKEKEITSTRLGLWLVSGLGYGNMSSTETKDRVWDKKVFEKIICLENLLLEGKETAEKNKLVRVVKNLVGELKKNIDNHIVKKNCAGKKESGENNLMFTIEIGIDLLETKNN